jgi:hypothetical protein
MSNKQYSFGLNTRNISTSNRTSTAVLIGSLKGGSKGSTSRIYKWCNRHCPADPIACVFGRLNTKLSQGSSTILALGWKDVDISQLNLGQITGNIGLNGQIIIAGSNGGQIQFSTNLGNTWAAYTGSPNLPGGVVAGWSSVVMSDDTNFVIATPYVSNGLSDSVYNTYNGIWYKRNGYNWSLLQSCPLEGGGTLNFNNSPLGKKLLFIDAGISQDGQYMAAITTPRFQDGELVYLITSSDYGATWSAKSLDPYTQDVVTTVTSSISICNSTDDYFLITSNLYYNTFQTKIENGTCCVSKNGGNFNVPSGVTGNNFVYSSMSDNGQFQVVVTATNPQSGNASIPSRLYLSTNSGTTFNQIIQLTYTDDNNYFVFGGVSMSADGKYITASVLGPYGLFQYMYVSSDTGVTWKKIVNDINGNSLFGIYSLGFLNTNYSGQYQMLSGVNKLYINNNYGN